MQENSIAITVLMPCYNAAQYIAEAIQSVLDQTFRDFELLIVNDGSTDLTASVVQSFTDSRIVLIEQSQQGIAAALNNGIAHARAAYIARFDADDWCTPGRLEQQYAFMLCNPAYIVIGSAADYMDETGNYVFTHLPQAASNADIKALSCNTCPFIHASVMYKKEVIAATGYNVHAHSFEDHLLWQQLKTRGKMYNMPGRLIRVRMHPSSVTMDEKKRPALFHQIKNKALRTGAISAGEGEQLLQLIRQQNSSPGKQGAYYSLLAKKFLWNNYNPPKARQHARKANRLNDFDIKDYLLLFISDLPKNMITNLYSIFTAR